MEMRLQFFGGRGESLSEGSGKDINIVSETDVWSYRHNPKNEPFVDAINTSVKRIGDDFPGLMSETVNTVSAGKLGGKDASTVLGYYGQGGVALNQNFTNVDKMNKVYDNSGGYHPSRGNKTGTEAVAFHEMGHALTDHLAKKMGVKDLDAASKEIVNRAYKANGGKGGTKKWAGGISGYAQENFAECVAEAVADFYCNGKKASSQSKAIMKEMKNIQKGGSK